MGIGIASLLSALLYTGGPYPLGYHGLGDVFVFIFFGLAAVGGTYYVQALEISAVTIWAAVPVGLLATAILVVNNLRDIETDRAAGKRTLAVRLGRRGAQIQYVLCLGISYLIPGVMWILGVGGPWGLLVFLSTLRAVALIQDVFNVRGPGLNKTLAGTGQLELLFSLLFSAGLVIG